MNKTDKLTPEILKINSILLNSKTNDKDAFYYKDLVYGIKRVLNLDVIPDELVDRRIAQRLAPEVLVNERRRSETFSKFAHEFYCYYRLAKINFQDKSRNKNTKELRNVFAKKRTKAKACLFTIK